MAKKRSNGEGAVHRQPNGTWRGQIMDGYRDNGKRNIVSFTGKTKGEVLDKIRDFKHRREMQGPCASRQTPFDKWAELWYGDYKSQVQPSTYANYRYILNVLKAYFGAKNLRDIKVMDMNRFFDYLNEKALSQSYITKCRAMLIQIFDAAEANELVHYNPARKSKSVRAVAGESKKDAFSQAELKYLEENLPDDLLGHSILLMIGSGLRTQELLALTAEDIAEDGSVITVNKAIKMVGGIPQLGDPKSGRGRRVVPVPKKYRTHALYLRNHSRKQGIWVSQRESGLYDVGVFRKQYYRAIGAIAGVRKLSPHCCRHTYISNLERQGVPMELIARLAGHSRITTTDGYLHTDLATLADAVAALN